MFPEPITNPTYVCVCVLGVVVGGGEVSNVKLVVRRGANIITYVLHVEGARCNSTPPGGHRPMQRRSGYLHRAIRTRLVLKGACVEKRLPNLSPFSHNMILWG